MMHLIFLKIHCPSGTLWRAHRNISARNGVVWTGAAFDRPRLHVGPKMEKAAAYAISALIVGFGVWILVAGLSSSAPALSICAALIPIAIGLLSAFGQA